ncbi:GNAT family N-acetyltransferase [Aneurinibacillus migulanus]|uniref:GNAT family N-acetyltransferase n=1 Tax=Aneurinibacillus migulanus TaxID=47500 RepID=UPI00209E8936|nr:GNAT family N-acetyltransferase [Aneurinibacillus migulanus]MCP1355175.1 GNAT family N-acetyltransferase [Aneurinibacillus migulanus]MED4727699.1 GNAT family N-acetyltransferase [Aneurinibacillus migulanus]
MKIKKLKHDTFRKIWLYRLKDRKVLVLRQALEEDAPQIIQRLHRVLDEGVYLEEEKETVNSTEEEAMLIRQMSEEGSMYTVAEIGDSIAGVAQIKRGQMEMNRHTGTFRIWLGPEFQGYGIGSKLMDYALQWAGHHGLKKVCLDVFADNERAIDMYKKYGFVVEGRRKEQFVLNDQRVDEVFMSKFI